VDRPPYPAALRLYAIAEERWAEIEAHYLTVDLLRLPEAKFTNAVYAWCVKYMTPEDREKWDMMLTAPLPGQEKRKPSEAEVEAEGAAFMQLLNMETQRKQGNTGD
jgi:hypothetical protein